MIMQLKCSKFHQRLNQSRTLWWQLVMFFFFFTFHLILPRDSPSVPVYVHVLPSSLQNSSFWLISISFRSVSCSVVPSQLSFFSHAESVSLSFCLTLESSDTSGYSFCFVFFMSSDSGCTWIFLSVTQPASSRSWESVEEAGRILYLPSGLKWI